MINRLIKNSAIVLTILTGFFYLVGVSYNQGYLAEFGITAKVFPLQFNEAILIGFVAIVLMIGNHTWHIIYVLIAIFLINVALVLISQFLMKSEEKNEELVNTKSNPKSVKKNQSGLLLGIIDSLKLFGNKIYDFLLFFIVLISFLGGTIYVSNSFGTERAQKVKEDLKKQLVEGEHKDLNLIEFFWEDSKTKGIVISYSDNYLLIYTEDFDTLIFNNSKFDYIRLVNN